MDSRRLLLVAGGLVGLVVVVMVVLGLRDAWMVSSLVSRNVEAHGGSAALSKVDTLRLTGQMDLGQGLKVPYVMEYKAPDKLCFEYPFEGEKALQCTNGRTGFKTEPQSHSMRPVKLSDAELAQFADMVPMGLLVQRWSRGITVGELSRVEEDGRPADRAELTLPSGAKRTLFVDPATGLEFKLVGVQELPGDRMIPVITTFHEWRETDGLFFPRRQVTRYEGDSRSYEWTIDGVFVNPDIDDSRFEMATATASNP